MEERMEEYFADFGEDMKGLVQRVLSESYENGKVSYELASLLMENAIAQDSDVLIGIAYFHLAQTDTEMEDKENVKICLLGCINYLQGKGPYNYIVKAYFLLGEIEKGQNNPMIAMEYYESGLMVCEEKKQDELLPVLLRGVGVCYYQLGRAEKALLYYDQCLKLYCEAECRKAQQIHYVRAMIERAKCLLSLKRIEEAKADRKLIKDILRRLEDEKIGVEADLFNALFYQEKGEYGKAVSYAEHAGKILDEGSLAESQSHVREYLYVLVKLKAYPMLSAALKRLKTYTDRSKDKNYKLHILKLRMGYTSSEMEEAELRNCVHEFFLLYDICTKEKNDSLIKNIEVRRQLRQIQEKQHELKILNQKLLRNSLHDALTGLPNRGYLNEHAEKIFERARQEECFCGICLLDIDFFKQLNDKYGHMAGDKCLKAIGTILEEVRNNKVFASRYGGDEFTLVFFRMDKIGIEAVLNNIQEKIRERKIPNENSKVSKMVTLSIGCFCSIPAKDDKMWDYFSRADAALYKAKYLGKDRFVVFGKEEKGICLEKNS